MTFIKKTLFILLPIIFSSTIVNSQTKIRGQVIDSETETPLAFANVVFVGSFEGCSTDNNGFFYLQTRENFDYISISYLGYDTHTIKIAVNQYQEITVRLKSNTLVLNEITITSKENPAFAILRKIIENKEINNFKNITEYNYEKYQKIEFDVTNLRKESFTKRSMQDFNFIFNYIDTTAENGKNILPFFLVESLSDVYNNNGDYKELIKSYHISGIEKKEAIDIANNNTFEIDIYKNVINIFDHDLISPISDKWENYYKYYLTDSIFVNNIKFYKICFENQQFKDYTFFGEMLVDSSNWGINKIKMQVNRNVSMNYVHDFIITKNFTKVNNTYFPLKEELFINLMLEENFVGLTGRLTTTLKNIDISSKSAPDYLLSNKIMFAENSYNQDSTYWNQVRHEKITKKENDIYQMVDSIKEIDKFKNYVNLSNMLVTGYWQCGFFDFGPIFHTYSYNKIEGNRFRIGGKTNREFSKWIQLNGYLAYGTKDEKFKYLGGIKLNLSSNNNHVIYLNYLHDYNSLSNMKLEVDHDNLLSAAVVRDKSMFHLMMTDIANIKYYNKFFDGFSSTLGFKYNKIEQSDSIKFIKTSDKNIMNYFEFYESNLNFHFCYNEKDKKSFLKLNSIEKFPILDIDFALGYWNEQNKYNQYYKLSINLEHTISTVPLGRFIYTINCGQIFNKVPFTLLSIPEGNFSYNFDNKKFNLMNMYEFVADRYASLTVEQYFDGFFINKIPGLNELNLKEYFYAKCLVGEVSSKNLSNNSLLQFPNMISNLNKPYCEIGFGIDNIYKYLAIIANWRLTHLDQPNVKKIGIFLRAKFNI
ncbi:MAG: DUF5686 and carboxypeptidase regulatory-like domain-containing protein [Bacteroidales bacterium]|nr:DUF5686 and carboxypeptidase regulatory-like domain-containing protein [Bacteroidales bacterium]